MVIVDYATGTAVSAWYDDVLPDLTGLTPGNAALKFIRDAAIEFCHRTQVLVNDLTLIDVTANVPVYSLGIGTDEVVVVPKKVLVNGISIDPMTDDDLDLLYGDQWRNGQLQAGDAVAYRCPDAGNLQLIPVPSATIVQGLNIRAAVKPSVSTLVLDDRLYKETSYRDAIAACAKWHAKASAKKPYSDPGGALYWRGEFERMVGAADIRASKGFTRKPLRSTTIHGVI